MSIRIGWSARHPREGRPGEIGRRLSLFDYTSIRYSKGRKLVVGWLWISAEDLLRLQAKGVKLHLDVVGVLTVDREVDRELFEAVVEKLAVFGRMRAPSLPARAS